jgi:hypothetical protein
MDNDWTSYKRGVGKDIENLKNSQKKSSSKKNRQLPPKVPKE